MVVYGCICVVGDNVDSKYSVVHVNGNGTATRHDESTDKMLAVSSGVPGIIVNILSQFCKIDWQVLYGLLLYL